MRHVAGCLIRAHHPRAHHPCSGRVPGTGPTDHSGSQGRRAPVVWDDQASAESCPPEMRSRRTARCAVPALCVVVLTGSGLLIRFSAVRAESRADAWSLINVSSDGRECDGWSRRLRLGPELSCARQRSCVVSHDHSDGLHAAVGFGCRSVGATSLIHLRRSLGGPDSWAEVNRCVDHSVGLVDGLKVWSSPSSNRVDRVERSSPTKRRSRDRRG